MFSSHGATYLDGGRLIMESVLAKFALLSEARLVNYNASTPAPEGTRTRQTYPVKEKFIANGNARCQRGAGSKTIVRGCDSIDQSEQRAASGVGILTGVNPRT